MVHRAWFILPPAQEFYYRKHRGDYRALPPYRADCQPLTAWGEQQGPIEILYTTRGTRLYIPTDLAEKQGKTVFEAVHRDPGAVLFWHLDDHYLGSTTSFHQQALVSGPGRHRLAVVDDRGNHLGRWFEVLGEDQEERG